MNTTLVRQLVREILLENKGTHVVDEAALALMVEFVCCSGILEAHLLQTVQPFVKHYSNLYRVWTEHPSDTPIEVLEKEASTRKNLSTTQDPSVIPEMLDMLGATSNDVAITKFDGFGFDPYEVIEQGLAQNPEYEGRNEAEQTLDQFRFQKEIVVLRVTSALEKVE